MSESTFSEPELENSNIETERAVPEDAEAIMRIKCAGWIQAYVNEEHGITLDDIKRQFTDEVFAEGVERWRKGIAEDVNASRRATFVARKDGEVLGFVAPVLMQDGRRRLGAMYVDESAQGLGIGGALLNKALEWHGYENDVYLNVVSYNDKAIGFYEHYGFVKTGVETAEALDEQDGTKLLPELEMIHYATIK